MSSVAIKASAAEILRSRYPVQAYRWAPGNANAEAAFAQQLITAGRPGDARTLATAAIRRDPTNVAAVRVLALAAEAEGRSAEAFRLFSVVHAMSRRDVVTEAWLLRAALQRGDYEAAINHFDISFRIAARAPERLIPLLVAAVEDARILAPLRRRLDSRPVWRLSFLWQLAMNGRNAAHVLALSRGLLDPAQPDERAVLRPLIQRLAESRRYDLALLAYRQARPGTREPVRAPWREQAFDMDDFPPFDWWLSENPDFSAVSIDRPDGRPGRALRLSATGGGNGQIARRVIGLAPGSYILEYDAGDVSSTPFERPQLGLSCTGSDVRLVTTRPAQGGTGPGRVRATFIVPPNCASQLLSIEISAAELEPDRPPWIADLSVRPATGGP